MANVFEFVIPGAPRTKKTHNQLVVSHHGGQRLLPSQQFRAWNQEAQMWLAKVRSETRGLPLAQPVNCKALFFRDAFRGDACGYYQALADALEEARIVVNDCLIVSWDGSRLLKDHLSPRIEVRLSATGEEWTAETHGSMFTKGGGG
jgi:hypothetical protein